MKKKTREDDTHILENLVKEIVESLVKAVHKSDEQRRYIKELEKVVATATTALEAIDSNLDTLNVSVNTKEEIARGVLAVRSINI